MKLLNEPKEATRVPTFGLKNTDRPLEQAETRLQETLKFKMSISKETFFWYTDGITRRKTDNGSNLFGHY